MNITFSKIRHITFSKIRHKIHEKIKRDFVRYKGIILPPPEMRWMGKKFRDDKYYLESSLHEGDRFNNKLNVTENSVILEIGCSSGRSVIGLLERVKKIKRYTGIDAKRKNVKWCNKHIARKHPFCEFQHIDLMHINYNPNGAVKLDENFSFNLKSSTYDLVYLNSVLPNSIDTEIKILAKEFYRLLKPGGTLFLTDFIEENVPKMTENPENYVMSYNYPRQIVRFEKNYFLKLFTDLGFVLDNFEYGTEIDFQSAVYFSKPVS